MSQSTTGTVSGTVKDRDGAAVSGAEVSLVYSQAVRRTALTGADGKFSLETVAPGSYALTVTKS
ncbi:MAG: carboxypeptidase-like regulatory domain-containing protein, partial [Acidobacteria bacterium]|nr:carboxypeptidase-like regulatory domain-containing protein [Acidobacteriota bacterium]